MKKRMLTALALCAVFGGCRADPGIYGPYFVGQEKTLANSLANQYRPSDQRIYSEGQARAATIPDVREQPVVVNHRPRDTRIVSSPASSERSAW